MRKRITVKIKTPDGKDYIYYHDAVIYTNETPPEYKRGKRRKKRQEKEIEVEVINE